MTRSSQGPVSHGVATAQLTETDPEIPGLHQLLQAIHEELQVVASLTKLTPLSVPFVWSPAAEEAFGELRRSFSSAPILVQPDPSRQFIVERFGP